MVTGFNPVVDLAHENSSIFSPRKRKCQIHYGVDFYSHLHIEYEEQMSRKNKFYIGFSIIVIAGYVTYKVILASTFGTPKDFSEARERGALISQEIVNLSNDLGANLKEINKLDKEGDLTAALQKTTELATKSIEIRSKAVELSGELEKMTSSLPKIKQEEAKQAVLDSVSNRLALIGRLINYSDYVYQLLSVLRDRFTNQYVEYGKVDSLIAKINEEVQAVNSFNQEAISAMEKFDKLQ